MKQILLEVPDFSSLVQVEINNACNLKCIMYPITLDDKEYYQIYK